MAKTFNTVTCNNCGWVHFTVSRKFAEDEVKNFHNYFMKLSKEEQDDCYGGKAAIIRDYEQCNLCDNTYKDFREAKDGDCPSGCTISPIIRKED